MIFPNSVSFAAALICYLPSSDQSIKPDTEGNRERPESEIKKKNLRKNTILNEHPVCKQKYNCKLCCKQITKNFNRHSYCNCGKREPFILHVFNCRRRIILGVDMTTCFMVLLLLDYQCYYRIKRGMKRNIQVFNMHIQNVQYICILCTTYIIVDISFNINFNISNSLLDRSFNGR